MYGFSNLFFFNVFSLHLYLNLTSFKKKNIIVLCNSAIESFLKKNETFPLMSWFISGNLPE